MPTGASAWAIDSESTDYSLMSATPLPLASAPGPKHSSTVAVPSEHRTSRSRICASCSGLHP
jgi:hypothetical protein